MVEQALLVSGVSVGFSSPSALDDLGLLPGMAEFVCQPAGSEADVLLHWQRCAELPTPRGELVYRPGRIWRMYRQGALCDAQFGSKPSSSTLLRIDASWRESTLYDTDPGSARGAARASMAIDLLVRTAILRRGGAALHAGFVDDGGRGLLFIGPSGAGKSTQCHLWEQWAGAFIINEDRAQLLIEGSRVRCFGPPWGGSAEAAYNRNLLLDGIVVLEQAPFNAIERLDVAPALTQLVARCFLPYWDPALLAVATANLRAMAERVPVLRLRCRPEPAVIDLVRAAL